MSQIKLDEILFDVQGISVQYHKSHENLAVDDVSFEVRRGEILGLVGESGSGKSTIAKVLTGLLEVKQGQVVSNSKNVQMIFQNPYSSLDPKMKVGEIVAEGIDNFKLAKNKSQRLELIISALKSVGLDESAINRYPHEFSGGQRQRIGIARAIAVQPDFLVCDEAVSALDVSISAQVINLLVELNREQGITMLFISHDLSIVHYISDRIIVLSHGKIEEVGTADDIFFHPQRAYTQELIKAVPRIEC